MNVLFVLFDAALAVLAVRSLVILGRRAPWTSLGWAGTIGYCVPAGTRFSGIPGLQLTIIANAFLTLLIVAFVVAGVRDEPQAEPWWWPTGVGLRRSEKRR
jgi:hypothetical protein